jgi:hypothetical protein
MWIRALSAFEGGEAEFDVLGQCNAEDAERCGLPEERMRQRCAI